MACSNPTVHWSGASFAAAPQLFLDAALTTVAPPGWYSFGGFAREMSAGGVLGPVQPCSSCIVPCGGGLTFGGGGRGLYNISFDMGTAPGAAVITFSAGVSNTTLRPIPDGLTWTYNGLSSSEGSALVGGYQTGLNGAQDSNPSNWPQGCGLTTALGTGGVSPASPIGYTWDASINSFISTGPTTIDPLTGITDNANGFAGTSPNIYSLESTLLDWNCTALSSSGCSGGFGLDIPASPLDSTQPIAPNLSASLGSRWPYSNGEYRGWTTVIPSPPGTSNPVATVVITAPCFSTWWGIHVQCPRQLTAIESSTVSPLGTNFGVVCQKALTTSMYHVPVDNSGNTNPNSKYYNSSSTFPGSYDPSTTGKFGQPDGVLGLHDWVFSDPNGVTPLPVGMYKVRFAPNTGGVPQDWVVEVGFREYKDVSGGHALPPEGYTGSTQSTGARTPGIVKSITPC